MITIIIEFAQVQFAELQKCWRNDSGDKKAVGNNTCNLKPGRRIHLQLGSRQ